MSSVPSLRIRSVNREAVADNGDYVLYWMIAFRRPNYNFSLQRAVEWANRLRKPLVILEPLRCDYPWASDRLHTFVIEGMADNDRHFAKTGVLYYPYIEPHKSGGSGLLRELARRACVCVVDDFPAFFLPRMIKVAARQIPVRFEAVDSNGLLPMQAADKVFSRAFDFRRFLQNNLVPHLAEAPDDTPLSRLHSQPIEALPADITRRWPKAEPVEFLGDGRGMRTLPVDHRVRPVDTRGGHLAASKVLKEFVDNRLARYADERNQPQQRVTSGLSPYLHFGHISVHQVFEEVTRSVDWTPGNLSPRATGSSSGWWGTQPAVESFLDELITWRELGYNFCWHRDDYDRYESLPGWAQQTLAEHEDDPRPHLYSLEQFESAKTHDSLWNAAQRQLVSEGRVHNYLRMLWGKKILEWSADPRDALRVMIELNNKYAVDGRDPNSYSGIFWVLGRYDRAWGPERPIFGKIRYMSSENTARKLKVRQYIEQHSGTAE